jgi:PII-like signaling protein
MKLEGPGKCVTVFIGETDHWNRKPLYAAIVERAREMGLAGATVTRGIMGFGAHSRMHTASILRLSEDLPIVIQIVDVPERIDAFLPLLDEMVSEGMVMSWDVVIERYVHPEKEQD